MCFFDPKIWIFGGQKSIFCLVIAIFVDGANDHYTRGYNFPIGTTPKKISVSELGVIFWGSPLFLAIPTLEGQLPLILVRFQRNSGESSGPSKNDPEGQRTRSGPESRRNGRFYVCLLYTSPSPRDKRQSRMPSSA